MNTDERGFYQWCIKAIARSMELENPYPGEVLRGAVGMLLLASAEEKDAELVKLIKHGFADLVAVGQLDVGARPIVVDFLDQGFPSSLVDPRETDDE